MEIMVLILIHQGADMPEDEYRRQPPDIQIVENSAEMLYGLIHQRWIISRAGLQAMVSSLITINDLTP
jgi:hypothetical protein